LQAGARSVSLSPKEATIRAAIASRCAAKTQIASSFLELGQRQPSIWDTATKQTGTRSPRCCPK
jgi:hypothetical protein